MKKIKLIWIIIRECFLYPTKTSYVDDDLNVVRK